MRHFFLEIESGEVPSQGDTVFLDKEESHHLGTVLRGGRESEVVLTDGRGHRFMAQVITRDRRQATLEILSVHFDENEFQAPLLVLALAVVKAKRFEWAVEKAVELGVHRIVPLVTDHGVLEPGGAKVKRWRTIMRSAIKQCGRSYLPELSAPVRLNDFLQQSPAGMMVFGAIAEEIGLQDQPIPLREVAATVPEKLPQHLTALIGPEGGWSEAEVQCFLKLNLQPITLGPHILRAETAATACLAGLQDVRQAWLGER